MDKRRVKYFDQQRFNLFLQRYLRNREHAKELKEAWLSFPGCSSISEVESYLNTKTKFVNTKLSATALGLEREYETIRLYAEEIPLHAYTEDFSDIDPEFKQRQREKFTEYWSEEDSQQIQKIENKVKDFNSLPTALRRALFIDRDFRIHFNESIYSYEMATIKRG